MTELVEGNVAVVTGGASGIGLALARAFAARGLKVVIADAHQDGLDAARAELEAGGADVLAMRCDVTRERSVRELAAETLKHFGTFDVVCNNVGTAGSFAPCWEIEVDEYERLLAVNVWSVVYGIRAFVPYLIEKKSGHVLNTASMAGLTVNARVTDYAMTKHAVVGLTEGLRADLDLLAPDVKASVLCPGPVRTKLAAEQATKFKAMAANSIGGQAAVADPLRDEVTLEANEVAGAAVWGIETDALYITPAIDAASRINKRVGRLLREAESCESRQHEAEPDSGRR